MLLQSDVIPEKRDLATGVDLSGYVVISETEYDDLMFDSYTLAKLNAGGVDNWEGYESSLEVDLD